MFDQTTSSSYLILFLTSNQSYANCLDGPYRHFAKVCAPRIPSKAEAWLQLPPQILVLEITKYEADVQVRFIELLPRTPLPLKDTDRFVSSNLQNTYRLLQVRIHFLYRHSWLEQEPCCSLELFRARSSMMQMVWRSGRYGP